MWRIPVPLIWSDLKYQNRGKKENPLRVFQSTSILIGLINHSCVNITEVWLLRALNAVTKSGSQLGNKNQEVTQCNAATPKSKETQHNSTHEIAS